MSSSAARSMPHAPASPAPLAPDATDLFGPGQLPALERLARCLAPSGVDPRDLLQEAIERALRNLHRFQPGTNFYAWMRMIMHRLVMDDVRARRRFQQVLPFLHAADDQDPEPEPWAEARLADVRAATEQLPEPLRCTFRLFVFERLTYLQISVREGIPLRTVGTRLIRARGRVRALLEAGVRAPVPAPSRLTPRAPAAPEAAPVCERERRDVAA
jgi:RNA polymerase sigma-70 factor, ECF subfamily